MDKKEEFKTFVRNHPRLVKYIKDGSMTWQKYYEIYDMYGDNNEAWSDYLTDTVVSTATTTIGINEIMNWLKNIDLDSIQNGVSSVQRVLSVFQDLGNKESVQSPKSDYKPRPLYKHFED